MHTSASLPAAAQAPAPRCGPEAAPRPMRPRPAQPPAHAQPRVTWHERAAPPQARRAPQPRSRAACRAQPDASSSPPSLSLFPAGQRQARVQLPALMLYVDAPQLLAGPEALEGIDAAVAGGATAVVLRDGGAGAAQLYEASLRAQGALRGRAPLLLLDRTDIAAAVSADGVLLSETGGSAAGRRRGGSVAGCPG